MQPYEFRLPAVLRVGVGTHRLIPNEVARLGARRVLVVSDPNCARIPEVAATVDALRARFDAVELFTDVPGEPTSVEVERGVAALSRVQGEALVVGIGGG